MRRSNRPPDPDYGPTLPNLVAGMRRSFGEREFLVDGDDRLTFAEVEARSAEMARGLLALGIGKGARVGLLMPNGARWIVAWLAAARIGALTAPFSTLYKPAELSWVLAHTDVDTLLVADRYLNHDYLSALESGLAGLKAHRSTDLFLPSHPYLRRILVWGDCDRPWAMNGPRALAAALDRRPQIDRAFLEKVERQISPADDLVIISTSGATAQPKAVVHTHGTALRHTQAHLHYLDLRPEDRTYVSHPLFWIGGLNSNLLPAMHVGCALVFSSVPKVEDILDVVEKERVTRLSTWPYILAKMAEEAGRKGRTFPSLRMGLTPPADELGREIPPERRLAGPLGMTETFGMHSDEKRNAPLPRGKPGACGRNYPGVERRIVDPATGVEVPPGTPGELQVRGYTLMRGYYKREREDVFLRDGFFCTGDICSIDEDGFIYYHGRLTEVIKSAGANVSPLEVEQVLLAHPGVQEAFVFGLPDSERGECVVAGVVARPGEAIDTDSLLEAARAQLSSYKAPRHIVRLEAAEVTRTASAKPNRPAIRQLLAERLDRTL